MVSDGFMQRIMLYVLKSYSEITNEACMHPVVIKFCVSSLLFDGYDISVSGFIVMNLLYLNFGTFFNALLSIKDGSYTTQCSGTWVAETCDWCC